MEPELLILQVVYHLNRLLSMVCGALLCVALLALKPVMTFPELDPVAQTGDRRAALPGLRHILNAARPIRDENQTCRKSVRRNSAEGRVINERTPQRR